MLQSNQLGFLTGERIDGPDTRAIDILRSIKDDTAAIRGAVRAGVREASRSRAEMGNRTAPNVVTIGRNRQPAAPGSQGGGAATRRGGGASGSSQAGVGDGTGAATAQQQQPPATGNDRNRQEAERSRERNEKARERAAERKRGKDGRFMGGGESDSEGVEAIVDSVSELGGEIGDKLGGAFDNTEKVDPIIEAGKEMKEMWGNVKSGFAAVAAPMKWLARPVVSLFRKKDSGEKALPIHKKILKTLKDMASQRNREGGGKGIFGMLMMILGPLLTIAGGFAALIAGVLGKVFSPIGMLMRAAFSGLGSLLVRAFGSFLGPAIGLFAAGFAGWKIGSWLYEKFGTQIVDAIESITGAAEGVMTWFQDAWKGVVGLWTETIDKISGFFGDIKDAALEKIGIKTGKESSPLETVTAGMGGKEKQAFLSTMTNKTDTLEYASAEELYERHKDKGITRERAGQLYGKGKAAIATAVYGGQRGMKLGNIQEGDAEKFVSRGQAGLEGRKQYEEASKVVGVDLVNNPEMAADPEVASRIAVWKWRSSGARKAAMAGDAAGAKAAMTGPKVLGAGQKASTPTTAKPAAPVSVSPPTPKATQAAAKVSAAPARVNIPKPVAVSTKMSSTTKEKESAKTVIQAPVIGQNMSDRAIAHLVTGGIGTTA